MFSINDFDETLRGPFEWDVKRLAASFTVAARDLGFDEATRQVGRVRRPRVPIARRWRVSPEMRHIDVWYTRLDADMIVKGFSVDLTSSGEAADGGRPREGADEGQRPGALAKLCRSVDGELRIVGNPPLITPMRTWRRVPNRPTSTG